MVDITIDDSGAYETIDLDKLLEGIPEGETWVIGDKRGDETYNPNIVKSADNQGVCQTYLSNNSTLEAVIAGESVFDRDPRTIRALNVTRLIAAAPSIARYAKSLRAENARLNDDLAFFKNRLSDALLKQTSAETENARLKIDLADALRHLSPPRHCTSAGCAECGEKE